MTRGLWSIHVQKQDRSYFIGSLWRLNEKIYISRSLAYSICLLLLLSRFSRVWLCATPETAAHQAPPSLGFSRQEHWSGLPIPSPMHESERWKWSCLVVSDSLWPHGLQPTRLLRPWDFPGKTTGVGCHCLLHSICLAHSNYFYWASLVLASFGLQLISISLVNKNTNCFTTVMIDLNNLHQNFPDVRKKAVTL